MPRHNSIRNTISDDGTFSTSATFTIVLMVGLQTPRSSIETDVRSLPPDNNTFTSGVCAFG